MRAGITAALLPCIIALRDAGSSVAATLAGVHDPSRITLGSAQHHELYSTGLGIITSVDESQGAWTHSSPVFDQLPEWARNVVPKAAADDFWAPDVLKVGQTQRMYYSISSFGSQVSCIGLAELKIGSSNGNWTDRGKVLCTEVGMDFNAIDPCPVIDPATGQHYMTFGSFWKGVYLTTLDRETGKQAKHAEYMHLAANPATPSNEIEASFLHVQNGTYFLFVNFGLCCRGVQSTYKIMVGRSSAITGPFVDKRGIGMTGGGGELFLATEGDEIGPGQIGIAPLALTAAVGSGTTAAASVFSYHFYSKAASGAPTLGLRTLEWEGAWPVAGPRLGVGVAVLESPTGSSALA
jgi:arabinan endo-1,5-alpha-L-arabinosidase